MKPYIRILSILCLLLVTITIKAQRKYYDAKLCDATEQVRTLIETYSDSDSKNIYEFGKEGDMLTRNGKPVKITREEKGYPITYDELSIIYNKKRQLIKLYSPDYWGLDPIGTNFEYDKNGMVIKSYDDNKNGKYYEYRKYDDHVNWTERKEYDLKTKKYIRTCYRHITYWSKGRFL